MTTCAMSRTTRPSVIRLSSCGGTPGSAPRCRRSVWRLPAGRRSSPATREDFGGAVHGPTWLEFVAATGFGAVPRGRRRSWRCACGGTRDAAANWWRRCVGGEVTAPDGGVQPQRQRGGAGWAVAFPRLRALSAECLLGVSVGHFDGPAAGVAGGYLGRAGSQLRRHKESRRVGRRAGHGPRRGGPVGGSRPRTTAPRGTTVAGPRCGRVRRPVPRSSRSSRRGPLRTSPRAPAGAGGPGELGRGGQPPAFAAAVRWSRRSTQRSRSWDVVSPGDAQPVTWAQRQNCETPLTA
jgi:hypothetical protein